MLAVAEMYVKGVSTRDAEAVMKEFGIESLSSSQVSRATKLLDDELEAWRNRSLGEVRYLIIDARYEKSRFGGVVRDVAILSAIGIGSDERRRVLGVAGGDHRVVDAGRGVLLEGQDRAAAVGDQGIARLGKDRAQERVHVLH